MTQSPRILLCGSFLSIVSAVLADDPNVGVEESPSTTQNAVKLTAAERRILGHLDRNGDGTLDPTEAERFPLPMRNWLRENELQLSWPMPAAEFGVTLHEMLTELRSGRFSTGVRGRVAATPGSRPAARPKAAPKSYSRVEINGYEGLFAERTFTRLDKQPTDGKITKRELDEVTRGMFEGAGVDIPDELDRETFLQHHVRIQREQ